MKFTSADLRPILSASIEGTVVYPVAFDLYTDRDIVLTRGSIALPGRVARDYTNAAVIIDAGYRDIAVWRAYTGWIAYTYPYKGSTIAVLRDCPVEFTGKSIASSYRRETVARIAGDILDAAGIRRRDISVPEVTLDRFAVESVSPKVALHQLLCASSAYTAVFDVRFFFDASGVFFMGIPTNKNANKPVEVGIGSGLLTSGDGMVEVVPAPIRHSHVFTLNGAPKRSYRTRLHIGMPRSRLEVWYA